MQKKLIIALALAAFIGGITAGIVLRPQPLQLEHGTLLEPARDIVDFELRTIDDASLTNDDLRGQWTLAFFGFTHCPDICPTTLQLLRTVRERLADDLPEQALPSVLLVSVDPQRDSVEALDTYTKYFGAGFRGATADDDALENFATDLGIVYIKVPLDDGDYTMDHSGAVVLIDPDVKLRAVFSPPLNGGGITDDLRALLERS